MRKLYFGLSGADVKELQMKLEVLGYANFIPSGFYGAKTHIAMRAFQKAHNLPATGVFGATEASLMGIVDTITKSELLYRMSLAKVGTDVTPRDEVDDDVSCAFSLDTIYKLTFGKYIAGDTVTISTLKLKEALLSNTAFMRVKDEKPGDIVVFPTTEGIFPNGHCYIVGLNGQWYSNSSPTGLWMPNYTKFTAEYRYMTNGKFTKYIFRLI